MKLKFLAAATAALLAGTGGAHAAVVTFNTILVVPNTFDGLYLNFLNGATSTTATPPAGWDFNPYNSGTSLSFFWNSASTPGSGGVASTTTGPYTNLAPGAVVSSASTFSAVTASSATTAFQSAGTHILGFRFFNESTSAINYGYLTMTNGASGGFPATITGWSFENTGGAITVGGNATPGGVPEPATWAMMMLGFGAMGAAMRRRPTTRVRYA